MQYERILFCALSVVLLSIILYPFLLILFLDRFVFDSSISDKTIQSEWNVVCEDATLLHFIEMCFLAGAAIGSLLSGTLSDEYGRRHTLMIVVALQAIIGE